VIAALGRSGKGDAITRDISREIAPTCELAYFGKWLLRNDPASSRIKPQFNPSIGKMLAKRNAPSISSLKKLA
jgi:hypothetical protein